MGEHETDGFLLDVAARFANSCPDLTGTVVVRAAQDPPLTPQ